MKLRGLRQARQRSGYSISQLATLTGLRRETITQIEHGKVDPQPYAMHRLAAALETSPADLSGTGNDTPAEPLPESPDTVAGREPTPLHQTSRLPAAG